MNNDMYVKGLSSQCSRLLVMVHVVHYFLACSRFGAYYALALRGDINADNRRTVEL